jgi:hypothetical protein
LGPWAFREVFYPSSGPGGYLSPTVSNLRTENARLLAKVEKLNGVMIRLSILKMIMLV